MPLETATTSALSKGRISLAAVSVGVVTSIN
jgi:hypothetical protein